MKRCIAFTICLQLVLQQIALGFSPHRMQHAQQGSRRNNNHHIRAPSYHRTKVVDTSTFAFSSTMNAVPHVMATAGGTSTKLVLGTLHADPVFVLSSVLLLSTFGLTLERRTLIGKSLSVSEHGNITRRSASKNENESTNGSYVYTLFAFYHDRHLSRPWHFPC